MTASERRMLSTLAGVIGFGAVMFFLLDVGPIFQQADHAPAWWTTAALIGNFATPVAVAILTPFLPVAIARRVQLATPILYIAALLSSLWVLQPLPGTDQPWILTNTALATSAAALIIPRAPAWICDVVISVLCALGRLHGSPDAPPVLALQDACYSFTFCAVFIALCQLTLGRAREVDVQTVRDAQQAVAYASAGARARERGRVDALLHDTVLAVLRLAARGADQLVADPASRTPTSRTDAAAFEAALARQARNVLASLDDETERSGGDDLANSAVLALLAGTLADVDGRLAVEVLAPPPGALPAAVARAIAGAAAEAARNSLAHSGSPQPPSVTVRAANGAAAPDRRGIVLVVTDSGIGFDPGAVPADRLGLRRSVIERLDGFPGGSGTVRSAPGQGTVVELRWAPR